MTVGMIRSEFLLHFFDKRLSAIEYINAYCIPDLKSRQIGNRHCS